MTGHADRTCKACKEKKRRCDKILPDCGLCRRTGRRCEYENPSESTSTSDDLAAMRTRIDQFESLLASNRPSNVDQAVSVSASTPNGYSETAHTTSLTSAPSVTSHSQVSNQLDTDFPASAFLDLDMFHWAGHKLPRSAVGIPIDVLAFLNQGSMVMDTSVEYFSTVHIWMPFVSKKRIDMGIPVQTSGPDLAMLLLAMKLVISKPDDVSDGTIYRLAKGFLFSLESSGLVSLMCLQAMILVALFEYSHSIYPAAWMSVGACARYTELLGLSCINGGSILLGQPSTWTEAEERRRTWWAVFVLDRLIALGNKRPCVLAPSPREGRLPVDDDAWDSGDVTRAIGHAVSVDPAIRQSGFARLCQTAIYIDKAQATTRQQYVSTSDRLQSIVGLSKEIIDFTATLEKEVDTDRPEVVLRLLAPRCAVRSSLFICLDELTCPEKVEPGAHYTLSQDAKDQEELEMQAYAMQVIRQASLDIRDLAVQLQDSLSTEEHADAVLGKISPLLLDGVYCASATLHWLYGECGNADYKTATEILESLLHQLGLRWMAGRKYAELSSVYDVSTRAMLNGGPF